MQVAFRRRLRHNKEEAMAFRWEKNPDAAIAQAKTNGKLVMLDFSAAPA